jgi:hypothetical protein
MLMNFTNACIIDSIHQKGKRKKTRGESPWQGCVQIRQENSPDRHLTHPHTTFHPVCKKIRRNPLLSMLIRLFPRVQFLIRDTTPIFETEVLFYLYIHIYFRCNTTAVYLGRLADGGNDLNKRREKGAQLHPREEGGKRGKV